MANISAPRTNQWEGSWRGPIIAGLTVLVLAGLTLWYGLPWIARVAAAQLPATTLDALGGQTLSLLDRSVFEPTSLPADRRSEIVAALDRLLTDDTPERVRVEFRKSPSIGPNALALPSGLIVMTDEMVALARHEEEIVAVLAHEVGHVHGRHSLRTLIQNSAVSVIVAWVVGDISGLAAGASTALLNARYSRDLEREADAFAAALLSAHGVPASRLANMLGELQKYTDSKGAGEGLGYLSTHPPTAERLATLRGAGTRRP